MKKLFLVAILAVALLLPVIALASAEQLERPFQASFVSTVYSTSEFSHSGGPKDVTFYGNMPGKSTLGDYTVQAFCTITYTGKECAMPDGAKGIEAVWTGDTWVLSFDDTGDQLFLRMNPKAPGQLCVNPQNGTSKGSIPLDVVGGTGRFVGATGTVTKTQNGITVAKPASPGKGMLMSFIGGLDGKITFTSGVSWPF